MQIEIRCSTVSILPSDASGFLVTAEVCDVDALLREVILGLDEKRLRSLIGDERFEEDARKFDDVFQRALAQCGLKPDILA
jgi:hypothetical protein